ncbi:MAG: anti-sigma factor ChrR (cupin superfamily) [Planctomycetota bacterium]|jgi:anti-sigma factor ChrR (cupin superfamily)
MKNELLESRVIETDLSDSSKWPVLETNGVAVQNLNVASSSLFETSILKLAPGAQLPKFDPNWGVELFVLSGTLKLPEGPLEAGGYLRRPQIHVGENSTETGCIVFLRTGPFSESDTELVHLQSDDQPWLPGQGGLRVKPLHSFEGESTALVHWPAGERFAPHQHWGGEEIFVLSGTFEDEHGRYPEGTWMRSPHLSSHFPFVTEETVILVKTGHMHPANFTE